MTMDWKTFILFVSFLHGIYAIRILNNFFYEIPTLHEDTDEEKAIVELKTEMHWSIGWLHGVYCKIKNDGHSDLFFIDGHTVKKHKCSSPGCGPTCYAKGCLSYLRQSEYVLTIRCDQNLFNYPPFTTDADTAEMRIVISKNQAPKILFDPGDVSLIASEAYINGIISRVSYTDDEADDVRLTCTGSDNFRLYQEFQSGSIVINKDLQNEKRTTFTVNIFATDRRNSVSQILKIRLIGAATTTTTTTITSASSNRVTEELLTSQISTKKSVLKDFTNYVIEEVITLLPSKDIPTPTTSTSRVHEELVTPIPSIELPTSTASTSRVHEELVTPIPSIEVPTSTASTSRVHEELVTPIPSIEVPIVTTRNFTGGRIPPSKDVDNAVICITILLVVMVSVTVAGVVVIIIITKRKPTLDGYRKLKESSDYLDVQEAGYDNPTYLTTSQET